MSTDMYVSALDQLQGKLSALQSYGFVIYEIRVSLGLLVRWLELFGVNSVEDCSRVLFGGIDLQAVPEIPMDEVVIHLFDSASVCTTLALKEREAGA